MVPSCLLLYMVEGKINGCFTALVVQKTKDIEVLFRNGYSKKNPQFFAKVSLSIGYGNPEWGAEPGKNYYRLHIKEVKK